MVRLKIFLEGGALYGFPGPLCSLCCSLFSVWGFLFLFVIGFLIPRYPKTTNGEVPDLDSASKAAYGAGFVYLAFIVGCSGRYLYLRHLKKKNAFEPSNGKFKYSAIPPSQ